MGFQGFTTSDNFRGGGEEPRLWSHRSLSAMNLDLNLNSDHRLLASKFHLLRVVQSTAERSKRVQNSPYAGAEWQSYRNLIPPRIYFPVLGMVGILVNTNISFASLESSRLFDFKIPIFEWMR